MISLHNERLQIEIEVEFGGRITSLSGPGGAQWLSQPGAELISRNLGDIYIRPEMGGWDEMIPTTAKCIGEDGVSLPDHGEAWSRAWEVLECSNSSLTTEITLGIRPLRLDRKIVINKNSFSIDYSIVNLGEVVTPAFWSAHPMFIGAGISKVKTTPTSSLEQSLLPLAYEEGGGAEYWWPKDSLISSIEIIRISGERLLMEWDPHEIPYFGIFLDNGQYCREPIISPQPAIAYKVSELAACQANAITYLEPGASKEFQINITLD